MPVSKICPGLFRCRSHGVGAFVFFLLLQAAAGLFLLPRPNQLSLKWSTTRNQYKRSSHQRDPPNHCTRGCWCTSPSCLVRCGHDGFVHTDFDGKPLFCCAGSASRTQPLRGSKRLPLTRSTAISTLESKTSAKRRTVVDRLPTALKASGHETSITTTDAAGTTTTDAADTTATDAAVELEEYAASPGTDSANDIANGSSIGVSGDEGGQHEAVGKSSDTWGARFRSSLRRKSPRVTESTGSDDVMVAKGHKGLFTYDWENGPRVKWVASKSGRAIVEEGPRKLCDYLALPPTEYSVLDPKMITRLTDDTFKMNGGTLNLFGTKVKPVVFMRVDVRPEESQANIVVERVELDGSQAVRSAGGTFNVSSTTVVASAEVDDGNLNTKELQTGADIEIELLVPNENFIPLGLLSRTGSFVMQRVVDIGLPQFTKFLKKDYAKWSNGDDSRSAVASENESLLES